MKIFVNPTSIHKMNKAGLNEIISHLKMVSVGSMAEADVIYSPGGPLNTEQFPNKKYIFGPHFSVFPNPAARGISGRHKNAVYIQPSQPSVNTWVNEFEFNNIPVKAFPFPLNMDRYQVSNEPKDKVLLYYKYRSTEELKFVREFLDSKGVKYDTIKYGSYNEGDYQKKLNRCKYVVWLGCHESQGFALESVLAKNIPMLVWSVKLRKQQLGFEARYSSVKSEVTTVPYWDDRCGEKFYTAEEMSNAFQKLIENIDNYKPREYVEETLSVPVCSNNFLELINSIGK